MQKMLLLFLAVLCYGLNYSQLINDFKARFKQAAVTNSSDFNTSRSNKEKKLNSVNEREPSVGEPAGGGNVGSEKSDDQDLQQEGENPAPAIQTEYLFDLNAVYNVRNSGEENASKTEFYVGEKGFLLFSEGSLLINDIQSQQLLSVDSVNQKVYVSTGQANPDLGDQMNGMLQRTGASKEVLGLKAIEFQFMSPQIKVWISETAHINEATLAAFRQIEVSLFGFNYSQMSGLNGILLGYTISDENQQIISEFQLSELNSKVKTVNLSSFEVMGN